MSGLFVYSRTLFYGYTFDDYRLIVANYHYTGNIKNIFLAFAKSPYWQNSTPFYRPVLTLSFMFDALMGGTKPLVYHLTNVMIHIAACCSLFMFLQKLNYDRKSSLAVSLLFCLHPALVQAVAWIPGRNDSLMTLFILLSFIFLIGNEEKGGWRSYVLHVAFFLAALFTKETAILMPVIFAFYRHFLAPGKKESAKSMRLYLGWAVCITLYLWARHEAIYSNGTYVNSLSENLIGLVSYLGKSVFPVGLSVLPIPGNINLFFGIITLMIMAGVAATIRQPNINQFIFGGLWFLLMLVPTIFRVTDFASFLEQRLYLPLVGFGIMVSEIKNSRYRILSLVSNYLVAPGLLVFCLATFQHSGVFMNSSRYWQNAVKNSPDSYFAHHMMGNNYLGIKAFNLAEKEYLESIRINPGYVNNYDKLSLISLAKGDSNKTEEWLLKAIVTDHSNPYSYNAYGVYLLKKNDGQGAEIQFKKALERITTKTNPDILPIVYYNLGLTRLKKGLPDEALVEFEKALQLNPLDAMIQYQIGVIKFNHGLWNEAGSFLSQAVNLDSSYGEAHDYWGMTLLNLGDTEGAFNEISRARILMPQNPIVYEHLSYVNFKMGYHERAVAYYDTVMMMGLKPDPEVLTFLKKYRKTGLVR